MERGIIMVVHSIIIGILIYLAMIYGFKQTVLNLDLYFMHH